MRLVSVAAVAENGVIGDDGSVPWPPLPADIEQYRARVADAPVVLGRRTFESMREDLPGTHQIVVSRRLETLVEPTAVVAADVEEALALASERTADDAAYVLGGATIYDLFQPFVDEMALSHVDGRYDGDARFPSWDRDEWTVVTETAYEGFTVREWRRTARSDHPDTTGGATRQDCTTRPGASGGR
jgi:dihydrofolate reductase